MKPGFLVIWQEQEQKHSNNNQKPSPLPLNNRLASEIGLLCDRLVDYLRLADFQTIKCIKYLVFVYQYNASRFWLHFMKKKLLGEFSFCVVHTKSTCRRGHSAEPQDVQEVGQIEG